MKKNYGLYSLTSLINKPTCCKNPMNPSCIDLILTNSPKYFQNSYAFETGLSDFHKIESYRKFEPKTINYRKYQDGSNDRFREALINELSKITISKNDEGLKSFFGVCRDF